MSDTMFLALIIGGILYVVEGIIVSNLTYSLGKKLQVEKTIFCRFSVTYSGIFWWAAYPLLYPLYKEVL